MTPEELSKQLVRTIYLPTELLRQVYYSGAKIPTQEDAVESLAQKAESWWGPFLMDWYSRELGRNYSPEELGIDSHLMRDAVTQYDQQQVAGELLAEWGTREPQIVLPVIGEAMEDADHRDLCCSVYAQLYHAAKLPYMEKWIGRLAALTDEQACYLAEGLLMTPELRGIELMKRMREVITPERTAVLETIDTLLRGIKQDEF